MLSTLQGAARMLIRVSADIVHFPKHVVPILTSTVMECQRAGLHRSAFSHCQALMQPDLVESINPAYQHKAAALLRQDPSRLASLSCSIIALGSEDLSQPLSLVAHPSPPQPLVKSSCWLYGCVDYSSPSTSFFPRFNFKERQFVKGPITGRP